MKGVLFAGYNLQYCMFLPGTTAAVLKLVGFGVGGLTGLIIASFLCYKFINPQDKDKTEMNTVETECIPTTNEQGPATVQFRVHQGR